MKIQILYLGGYVRVINMAKNQDKKMNISTKKEKNHLTQQIIDKKIYIC